MSISRQVHGYSKLRKSLFVFSLITNMQTIIKCQVLFLIEKCILILAISLLFRYNVAFKSNVINSIQ